MFVQAKIQPVSLSDQEDVIMCTCTYIYIYNIIYNIYNIIYNIYNIMYNKYNII